jgi:hypothetical protein
MIRLLTLPVFADAGFADGARGPGADTPAGRSRGEFRAAEEVWWWARLEPEWLERRREIELVWWDPGGRERQRGTPRGRGAILLDALDSDADAPGIWAAEARLDGESLGRWTFRVVPAPS